MASSKEYVDFILEQCEGLTARAMMGEYVLYYGGKVVGGVYDNRLLVKPTSSAKRLMPNAPMELPYEGAKEMLLVENMEDKAFLQGLFAVIAEELPTPKRGRKWVQKISFIQAIGRSGGNGLQSILRRKRKFGLCFL